MNKKKNILKKNNFFCESNEKCCIFALAKQRRYHSSVGRAMD